jgi:hypothetical protein
MNRSLLLLATAGLLWIDGFHISFREMPILLLCRPLKGKYQRLRSLERTIESKTEQVHYRGEE